MKKILVTGSTGFIGRNILPVLRENKEHQFYTPSREELNLKDEAEVRAYLEKERFDAVIHLANPNPVKNKLDQQETMFEDSLRIFLNFYHHADLYGKMIYIGSGAEFDKSKDISMVKEEDCFRSIPKDSYGLAKVLFNRLAESSRNVYNFRIFGCYGPGDHESKFITHCIRSVLLGIPVTIRKDCEFDYLHVYDLARYLDWGIDAGLKYHNYNISSGTAVLLSEIAGTVIRKMDFPKPIELLSDERNRSYTADNSRVVRESGITPAWPLEKGIEYQISWEKDNWSEDVKFDGK